MRPLSEDELEAVFEKLMKYVGTNVKHLVDRPDASYCFRLHKDRVFYVPEDLVKISSIFARKDLLTAGTILGKFTHHKNFRLHITALPILAQYAQFKVWVKSASEMAYCYGHHVTKAGLGRISEDTPAHQGVVVLNMRNQPLGFGVTARSTEECRNAGPQDLVCLHQADVGEYLRNEAELV